MSGFLKNSTDFYSKLENTFRINMLLTFSFVLVFRAISDGAQGLLKGDSRRVSGSLDQPRLTLTSKTKACKTSSFPPVLLLWPLLLTF